MTIPQVRTYLEFISICIEGGADRFEMAQHIRYCITQMYRRPYVRKAPNKAPHAAPLDYAILRADAFAHPEIPYRDIGQRNGGFDGGRVSEACAGFRM
jgi:hypothetical protein